MNVIGEVVESGGSVDFSDGGNLPIGGPGNTTNDATLSFQVDTDQWIEGIDESDTATTRPFKIARSGDIGTNTRMELADDGQVTLPFYTTAGHHLTVGASGLITSEAPPAASPLQVTKTLENTVDGAVLRTDGTSGRLIQDGNIQITDGGNINGIEDLSMNGNITVGGTVDGRDVGADGATLDAHTAGVGAILHWESGMEATNYAKGNLALGNHAVGATNNLAIGDNALGALTTSDNNVAVGHEAGQHSFGASTSCTYIGSGAGKGSPGSSSNNNTVAVGYRALNIVRTGNGNTAVGSDSQRFNTAGSFNTCVGYQAGDTIAATSRNTLIGQGADLSSSTGINDAIALGQGAIADVTRTCTIGSTVAGRTLSAVKPATTIETDLGSTTKRWNTLYSQSNNVAGTCAANQHTGTSVNVSGTIQSSHCNSFTGRYDRVSGASCALGETNATSVGIARTGITTTVKGPLVADEGATITGELTVGGHIQALQTTLFDLTGGVDTSFYPLLLNHSTVAGPIWVQITKALAGGGDPYNNIFIRGTVNGGGFGDAGGGGLRGQYELDISRFSEFEKSCLGFWVSTTTDHSVCFYLRGNYTYYVTTSAQVITGSSAPSTVSGGSTYGAKDATGADISIASVNIEEKLDIINTVSGRYYTHDTTFTEDVTVDGNLGVGGVNAGPAGTLTTTGDITSGGVFGAQVVTVAGLPAVIAGGVIYVSDETGGATLAFSDGTNWRRVSDRAIVA